MPGQQSMIEKEFDDYTNDGTWTLVYHQIKNQASITHKLSQQISRLPANRDRNRYRDVSPYDDYRVKLENTDNDYVNASLVKVPISKREYILTQGPLMNTSGHFWLMVWQQNSLGVLMLNRIVENNRVKCHLYFPLGSQYGGDDMLEFPDVGLTVDFVDLENFGYYCKRTLKLTHLKSGETRKISQYHYTSWPDFDVPDTPTLFLDFLYAVRDAGLLSVGAVIDGRRTGPPVIHCSAGIGRSGTFCLVDSALVVAGGSSPKTSGSVLKNLTEFADKVKNPPPQSWQDYKRKQEMQIQQQIDKSEAEQAAIEVFEKDAARKRTAEERESADRPAEQEVADSEARETVEKDAVSKEAVARVNSQRKVDAIQYQPDTEMQSSINQPSSKNPSLYVPTPIQSTQSKSEVESTAALEYKPQLSGEFSPDISTAYPPEEPISDKKPSEATTKLQPAMNTQRQPSQPSAPKNLPSRPSAPSEAPPIPVIPSPPMPSSATPKLSMPTAPPPVSSAAPPRPSYPTPQSTMPLKSPPRPVNMPTRPSANVVQAVGRGKPPATISQRLVTPPRPPTFTPRFTSASSQSSQHVMQTVQTIPILGSNQSVSASFTPTPRVTATRTVGPRMVTPRPAASPAMGHLSATDQQDALDLLDNIALGGQKIQTVGQNRTPPRLPPRFTPPRPRFEQPYQPPPKRPAYHNQYNHYQGGNSYY